MQLVRRCPRLHAAAPRRWLCAPAAEASAAPPPQRGAYTGRNAYLAFAPYLKLHDFDETTEPGAALLEGAAPLEGAAADILVETVNLRRSCFRGLDIHRHISLTAKRTSILSWPM